MAILVLGGDWGVARVMKKLSSTEKALVRELVAVMRRHYDLGPTKLAHLIDIAFALRQKRGQPSAWGGSSRTS